MPPKPRKIFLALGGCVALCALVCAFFGWRSEEHARAWRDGMESFELLFMVLWLFMLYKFPGNRPAIDSTIHLFPKSTEASPESHNQ